jgi:hypothetical protein
MTAGSCSVAIGRSRPPQCGHARTSIENARCINAAQLQAREPLFAFTPSAPASTGARGKPVAHIVTLGLERVSRRRCARL